MVDPKERLVDGDVLSHSWLPTGEILADLMTKETKMNDAFEDIIQENIINIQQPLVDKVVALGMEIRMKNIRNR